MFSKKILTTLLFTLTVAVAGFFYFRHQVYFSHGSETRMINFEVSKGEGNAEIATRLVEKNIIASRFYFFYHIQTNSLVNKIMPGNYLLSGTMTIPEIVHIITNPEEQIVKITFPEGLTAKDMAGLFEKNGFDSKEFLRLVNDPGDFKKKYPFLDSSKVATLEGYLFPDTYFFKKDATLAQVVTKMLDNFNDHMTDQMMADMKAQNLPLTNAVIMASIVEKEVITPEDMKTVSGIFWNRINQDMLLQSDAPLSYILDDKVDQHSIDQIKTDSPYNTYVNKGLPPGPISNPGMNAIEAAIYPEESNYLFFFTVGKGADKKTIFSKTFEEHVANRQKYGI